MNNQDSNLKRVIEAGMKYGYTEEQIVTVCDEIGRAAYEQFHQEVGRLFSAEELQEIEKGDKEAASEKIKQLYHQKTGKDAQEVINGYLARHINDFITDHENSAPSSTV